MVTPQILDVDLWHKSGHYDNYRESMFFADVDEREFAERLDEDGYVAFIIEANPCP